MPHINSPSLRLSLLLFVMASTTFSQTNFWEQAGSSLGATVTTLAIAPNGHIYALAAGTTYRSSDGGSSWNRADTTLKPHSGYIAAMTASLTSGTLVLAVFDSVYRSTDEGASWMTISCNYPIMNLTSSPTGGIFAGTSIDGPVRSTDDGLTWENFCVGLTQYSMYAFAFKDSGVTFTSSYGGAVYRSTNYGQTWTPIPCTGNFADVLSLASQSNGYLFAGTTAGVFRTSDNGATWVSADSGLSSVTVRSLCLDSAQHLFAATPGGVFRSVDLGGEWAQANSGLHDLNVYSLAIAQDGHLFAGTASGQIYRSVGSTNSIRQASAGNTREFALDQNYPDPFNPSTIISYQLPMNTFVTLEVYDMLGRRVTTLVNEKENAGTHSVMFNGSFLSSGVYLYRLQTGTYSETKKFVLLK